MRRVTSPRTPVWLFDLDNTLHDAAASAFAHFNTTMNAYIVQELGVDVAEADRLRRLYWRRYGATLPGLVRHHGVRVDHFVAHTHAFPGLEAQVVGHAHDVAALKTLPGRKVLLTNAGSAYARRVLRVLGLARVFEQVIGIEHMHVAGSLRPKPDARLFRAVARRLGVAPGACVLVEDSLANQKAARAVGMRTVWMQRWLAHGSGHGPEVGVALHRRPAYVCARIRSLSELHELPRVL